jgi:nicotinamide riboside kinase
MTRRERIGLIGGECTGKSTLAAALGARLPGCVVPEALREFVALRHRPPAAGEQESILREQVEREALIASRCAGVVIADPAPLMTAIYSLAYFDDDSLLPAAAEHARGYDLVVWCDVDLPWIPDEGQRDGPEYRLLVHGIVGQVVADVLVPAGLAVIRASGSVDNRLDAVTGAWQRRPPALPT